MSSVFQQLLILFSFSLIGFFLAKTKRIDSSHTRILSASGVYVFLPATIYRSFASNFTAQYIREKYDLLLLSLLLLVVFYFLFHFVVSVLTKDEYRREIYHYSLLITNYSYLGYALTSALFGEKMLLNMMIFTMPLAIYIHTIGFSRLTQKKFSLKNIVDPSLFAIFLGMVTGLSGLSLPAFLQDFLSRASACMAPVSMLMTGMVISEFGLAQMLKNKTAYFVVLIRLVILPVLLSLILRPFFSPSAVTVAILVSCLPCGLNTVVFPRLAGKSCEDGASLAILSNVFCCLTIPFCVHFLL